MDEFLLVAKKIQHSSFENLVTGLVYSFKRGTLVVRGYDYRHQAYMSTYNGVGRLRTASEIRRIFAENRHHVPARFKPGVDEMTSTHGCEMTSTEIKWHRLLHPMCIYCHGRDT
jgi:hypothetical protein